MFQFDNPIFEILGKVVDIIVLGALWFVMCIPIITIGASTTAAYYVAFNQLNGKDGYVVRSFFKSFKQNFRQSTILFLIIVLFSGVAATNIYIIKNYFESNGTSTTILIGIQMFIILESIFVFLYSFALLSKINFNLKNLLLTSLQMANRHLIITFSLLVIIVAVFFSILYFPILFLFGGAIYLIATAFMLRLVIKKYRPDIIDTYVIEDELASFE